MKIESEIQVCNYKIKYLIVFRQHSNSFPLSSFVSREGPNSGIPQEEKHATRGKSICRSGEQTPHADSVIDSNIR